MYFVPEVLLADSEFSRGRRETGVPRLLKILYIRLGFLLGREVRKPLARRWVIRVERTPICFADEEATLKASYLRRPCLLLPNRRQTRAHRRAAARGTHGFDIHIQLLDVASQGIAVHA